jgi:large subunit ribosomal protein L10
LSARLSAGRGVFEEDEIQMQKRDKERIVAELTERLRTSESMIVADYRGLSVSEIDDLRTKLIEAGARFSVVKNTLTRLAAEAAGTTDLLELLEGPTAIAFIQADGDPVAVAKVLSETARTGRVLVIRGGMLEGKRLADADIEELARLPAVDVLRGQVLGAIVAPLTALAGLVNAPLQDLVGLIDARIDQLGGEEATAEPATAPEPEPATEPEPEPAEEAQAEAEPAAEAEPEAEAESQEASAAEQPEVQSEEVADATSSETEGEE